MFEVDVKNVTGKEGRGPARVWGSDTKRGHVVSASKC